MSTGNNHPEGTGHPGLGNATTQATNPPGGGERTDVVATLGGEGGSRDPREVAWALYARRLAADLAQAERERDEARRERDELRAGRSEWYDRVNAEAQVLWRSAVAERDTAEREAGALGRKLEAVEAERDELKAELKGAEVALDEVRDLLGCGMGEPAAAGVRRVLAELRQDAANARIERDIALGLRESRAADLAQDRDDCREQVATVIGRVLVAIGREHLLIEGPVSCDAMVAEVERVVRDLLARAGRAELKARALGAGIADCREQVASAMRILAGGVLDGALPWEDCARVIRLLAGAIAPKGEQG